jgi:TolB protein
LVAVLSVSIFSLNTFVMLPTAVVSNQPHQLLQSAYATFPGENGNIAFTAQRDGDFGDIYVMNADGSEQTNISNNSDIDSDPDWSPDGAKIVFVRFSIGGNSEIYVMNADGSEQERLTNNGNSDDSPNWSPDGTKIAFASDRDGNSEIYVMNADGTNPVRLTNNDAGDFHPNWSPDGTKIAFASNRDGFNNDEVYVMNADGSEQERLTNNDQAYDYYPDWSPDGTKIAFASNRDGNGEIYVMNADGTNPVRLTTTEFGGEEPPSWSPDGTKIVFGSTRDVRIPDSTSGDTHNWEIYVMNADGSEQTNISNNPAHDLLPDWGPASEPPEEDTTPPVLSIPEDITAQATTANGGTVVTYNVTAEDGIDGTAILEEDNSLTQDDDGGTVDISCDPASGTEFPIGETIVECTATDTAGNSDTESFMVTVNPPPDDTTPAEATEELISDIENLQNVPQSTKTSLSAPLRGIVNILHQSGKCQ